MHCGNNPSKERVGATVQDIVGQKLEYSNFDRAYTQIVGKTNIDTALRDSGYAYIGVPFPCVMCHSLFADG